MSGTMKYNFAAIAMARDNLVSGSNYLRQQLDDLDAFLKPLVASWEGQAAQNYNVAQGQWNTAADDLRSVLNSIGIAVGQGNENMQATEQRAAASW